MRCFFRTLGIGYVKGILWMYLNNPRASTNDVDIYKTESVTTLRDEFNTAMKCNVTSK